jgi:DNA topoisomerase-3
LIFDPNSKPNWRMDCNLCNFAVFLPQGAHSKSICAYFHSPREFSPTFICALEISLLPEKCEECGMTELDVEFNLKALPPGLPEGSSHYSGCVLCDEFLNGLVHSS